MAGLPAVPTAVDGVMEKLASSRESGQVVVVSRLLYRPIPVKYKAPDEDTTRDMVGQVTAAAKGSVVQWLGDSLQPLGEMQDAGWTCLTQGVGRGLAGTAPC